MALIEGAPLRTATYSPAPKRPRMPVAPGAPATPTPPGGAAPPSEPSQIPGTGTYLQQQAQATQAYESAKNDINYRRGQMYSQFGLLPNGQVDANSQYGQYQQMLGGDAQALRGARDASQSRGLGDLGLGGRVMQSVRNAQGANHFGFQQTLLNNLHGFDMEGVGAQQKYAGDMLGAQQGQEQWDFEHNQFTPAPPPPVAPAKPKPNKHVAKQRLAQHLAAAKRPRRP